MEIHLKGSRSTTERWSMPIRHGSYKVNGCILNMTICREGHPSGTEMGTTLHKQCSPLRRGRPRTVVRQMFGDGNLLHTHPHFYFTKCSAHYTK